MDLEKIRKLIEFVGASRISDLTVTEHGVTVHIARKQEAPPSRPALPPEPPLSVPQADEPVLETEGASTTAPRMIAAPSFGVFHRAPSPGAQPFVEVGEEVAKGQSLFIVEAMKVFNTVRAEQPGKIVRIFPADGEDVELGQPLMEIA